MFTIVLSINTDWKQENLQYGLKCSYKYVIIYTDYTSSSQRRKVRIPAYFSTLMPETFPETSIESEAILTWSRQPNTPSEDGKSYKSTQQFLKQASDQGRTKGELEQAARDANGGIFASSMVGSVGATGTNEAVKLERDAYAARDTVTFSEPTGLSLERQKMNQIVRFILLALTIAAIAVIVITVSMVVKKTKYDDKNIIDSNKN